MEQIELIEPKIKYAADIWKFRQEILDCDAESEDQFAGCKSNEVGTTVPSHMYLAIRKNDNKVIGIIDLRHHINHPILET